MLPNQRILFKDNSSFSDLSVKLNEYLSGTETLAVIAAEDALYLGSDLPFNHRWIEVSTPNALASKIEVKLWDDTKWVPAVDVNDQSSINGVTLAKSGILSWTPDRDESWAQEDTTEDIPELSSFKIYDLYWAKFTFSGDLTPETALKYLGYKFSGDADLLAQYPELANQAIKTSFQTGKTTWDDQAFIAAEEIIKDLKVMNIIWSKNQILDWSVFRMASVHKMAEMIFRALGSEYETELKGAMRAYKNSLNIKMFHVDKNKDARLGERELKETVGFFKR